MLKTLLLLSIFLVVALTSFAQDTDKYKTIDTTYSDLVYAREKVGDEFVSGLSGSRHKFKVVEKVSMNNNYQVLELTFNDRKYLLTILNKKAVSLHLNESMVAAISDTATIINNTAYTFKKLNDLEFSYSTDGREIMHGKVVWAKFPKSRYIYGQYLDFKKYQHENQEALVVLASVYSTTLIDKMSMKHKSFLYNVLKF